MKTSLILILTLTLAVPAFAQDRLPADAPVATEPTAPTVFPPGDLPPGRVAKLRTGEPAPFPGRLFDEQEQVRRERLNERKGGELASLKQPSNVTVSVPAVIAIAAGALVLGAAIGTGITLAAAKPKP